MLFKLDIACFQVHLGFFLVFVFSVSYFSALVKLMNKSIEGTADDEEEGVSPDTAIRAGLELLKVIYIK